MTWSRRGKLHQSIMLNCIVYVADCKTNKNKVYYTRVVQEVNVDGAINYYGGTYFKKCPNAMISILPDPQSTFAHYHNQWSTLSVENPQCCTVS